MTPEAISIQAGALRVGPDAVPLISGEVQFWRMDPDAWRPALDAAKSTGFTVVATYLSWRRHEPTPGAFEWGAAEPRLDVRAFVRSCAEAGLLVHLKPGPWICAEEPGGGYPDWLLAQDHVAAQDAWGRPVVGYNPPFTHRVPCYRNPAYRSAVRAWFAAVWEELADLRYPDGPIVAVQLDNEPSHCFSHALHYADYHPLQITAYRDWLANRYPDDDALGTAWNRATTIRAALPPLPTPPPPVVLQDGTTDRFTADWVDFCGDSITDHLVFLRELHADLGAGRLLPTVNIINPPVFEVPLSHPEVRAATGAATGVDHYYEPPLELTDIDRLAKTAAFARLAGEPLVWAPELMAGIWRSPGEEVSYPDPTPEEQAAWWGAALALGYQGFNLYMLAGRDNWEYAPIEGDQPSSGFFGAARRLVSLLQRTPDVLRAQPVGTVALAWHRPDAVAAYCVTGTARGELPVRTDPLARRAYDAWASTALDLLREGIPYDLVDTSAPRRASGEYRLLLLPPHCSTSSAGRFEELGWRIVRLSDASGAARVLSASGLHHPPAQLGTQDHTSLVRLTQSDTTSYLHLVNWGRERSEGVILDPRYPAHGWRSLDEPDHPVDLTALTLTPGHTVMARDR